MWISEGLIELYCSIITSDKFSELAELVAERQSKSKKLNAKLLHNFIINAPYCQ